MTRVDDHAKDAHRIGPIREIGDLALFARAVTAGSMTRCAERLNVDRSTISRRIAALEASLGVKLLDRSGRRALPTEAGRACLSHCLQILESAEKIVNVASREAASLRDGRVQIATTPGVSACLRLPDVLERLRASVGPRLSIALESDATATHADDADAVLTWNLEQGGEQGDKSGSLLIALIEQRVYASPAYSTSLPELRHLDEFLSVNIVSEHSPSGTVLWSFEAESGSEEIRLPINHAAADLVGVRDAVVHGAGVAVLPEPLARDLVRRGLLVEVAHVAKVQARPLFLRRSSKPVRTAAPPGVESHT